MMTEKELLDLARAEYARICTRLSLRPVADFVLFAQYSGSDEVVAKYERDGELKVVTRNEDASAYRPGLLFLSVDSWTMSEAVAPETFPPAWADRWPRWRSDLWHEVCHQFQDEILGAWDPLDGAEGHLVGWNESLVAVARAFRMTQEQFHAFVDAIWSRGERGRAWVCPQLDSQSDGKRR